MKKLEMNNDSIKDESQQKSNGILQMNVYQTVKLVTAVKNTGLTLISSFFKLNTSPF